MKQIKHKTLLARASMMLLAMLCFLGGARATEVEIGDGGTTNNSYLPGYNYYKYSLTQQIYTADEIGMAGTINSIAFKNTGAEKTRNYKVYMLLTDKETFSSGTDWVAMSDVNLVFDGSLTFTVGEWTTIVLDTPFAYDGSSNLIVGVADNTGSYSSSPHMACLVFGATSQAIRAYRDSGAYDITNPDVTGYVHDVKNQIVLDITPSSGHTCAKPENLEVSDITGYGATLTWTSDVGNYTFEYKKDSESEWTVVSGLTTKTYELSNLEPSTKYNARVKAVCDVGLESGYRTTNFTTDCLEAYPIPYAYGFENAGAIECWTISGGDGYSSVYDNAWSEGTLGYNAARTGDNFFMFYYTQNYPQYLISPKLSGIENGLHVEFYYRQYEQGVETFQVGYSTSDNDPDSFTWGDEITASTSYQRFSANYPKETKYVAIKHTSEYEYLLYIDDFLFEESASCLEPTGVTASNATTTGATISWTPGSDEATWDIFVTDDATVVPTDATTPTFANVTSNPYSLTGLSSCTIYYVYVRAIKGSDKSAWSSPVIFHTKCEPMALPYSYDFEDEKLPISWSTINTNTSYNSVNIIAPNSSTNNRTLSFYRDSSDGTLVAILPEVAATYPLNGYQISFDACYANNNSGKLAIGIMTDPTDFSSFTLIEEVDITNVFSNFVTHTVMFNNYPGEGHFIAIQNIYTESGYVLVDNVAVTELPSCIPPTDLSITNITSNSADLSWTARGKETAWTLYYKKSSASEYTSIVVNENPYTLTGLDAATAYQFYVVANCSDTDTSDPSEVYSFTTDCGAIASLPWTEDFDAYTGSTGTSLPSGYPNDEMPSCWRFLNRSETSSAYPQVFISSNSGYPVSGNCLFFKSSSTTPLYAVLPTFAEDISGLQLTFTYRNEGTSTSNGTLIVGYMTNPTDATTFTAVHTCEKTSSLTEQEVVFSGAPANSYIAFMYQGGSYNNYYLSIDNVTVDVAPSCLKPTGLSATNITENSAVLSWTAGGSETAWTLYYKKSDAEEYSEGIEVAETPSYTLEGLEAFTSYQFCVVANCSPTEESGSSEAYTFKTSAAAVTTFPWTETFNELTDNYSIPEGWDNSEGNTLMASYKWYYNTSTSGNGATNGTGHDGTKCVRFNSYGNPSGQYNFLKTVPLVLPAEPDMQLTFWYKNPAGGDFSVYISTDGGATHETALVTGLTGIANWTEIEPISLSAYAGKTVVIVFKGTSNYGNDDAYIYLDDVTVKEVPSCATPTHLAATTTNNSAVLSWTAGGSEEEWTLYYREVGGEWIEKTVTENPSYTLTNLTAQTAYEFYVVANCNEEDESEPSLVYSFTTKCAPITEFPWSEDFNDYSYTGDFTESCWENKHISGGGALIFQLIGGTYGNNSSLKLNLPDQTAGTMTKLMLPGMTLPNANYQFSIDVYRNNSYTAKTGEGIRVFVSTDGEIEGATELAFIPRVFSVESGVIPAEAETGWYTYSLPIGISGNCYIILRGESQYGSSTFMDNFEVSEIPTVTFAKEGYATYYNGVRDVVLPAGMKAHVVTASDASLTYAKIADGDTDGNVIPAGTAVLLQVEAADEAQTLPIYLATPSADSYTGTNYLFGSDTPVTTSGGAKYYKLTYSNSNNNFGWYWGAANGGAFISPAHKAWLALPASAPSFLGLPDWEDTTGIIGIDNGQLTTEEGEWYTLQGLKIGKKPTTAGVYIHNGRKVLIP